MSAIDVTTLLRRFIDELYTGTFTGATGVTLRAADGSANAPTYSFASETDMGFFRRTTTIMGVAVSGTQRQSFLANGFRMASNNSIFWSPTTDPDGGSDTDLSRQAAGRVAVMGGTATPAGGSTGLALVFGSTSGFGIYIGSGAPTVSAAQGSIYLRSDGSSTSTRMYVNSSAGSGTTWTNFTTAA